MASWRTLNDPEVDAYLGEVAAGRAGQNPRDMTAARSSDPRVARAGMYNMQLRARDQQRQADEQERLAEEQQRLADKMAKERAKVEEAARMREVRRAAAQGAVTATDPETGHTTTVPHPSGSGLLYKPAPIGKPMVEPIRQDNAVSPTILGGDGAVGGGGAEVKPTVMQRYRNDRGQQADFPVESIPGMVDTDPKTGIKTMKVKDDFGIDRPAQIGIDTQVAEKQARSQRLGQQLANLDVVDAQHKVEWDRFMPNWEPVKDEYEKAKKEVEGLDGLYERRGDGWVRISRETGSENLATPSEVDNYQRKLQSAKQKMREMEAKYAPLAPQADMLEKRKSAIQAEKNNLALEKARMDADLPEIPSLLEGVARGAGAPLTVGAHQGVQAVNGGPVGVKSEDQQQVEAETLAVLRGENVFGRGPLLPPDLKAQGDVTKAFGALKGLEGFEAEQRQAAGGSGATWTALHKDGVWFASAEDGGGGQAIITLRPEARQTDIWKTVDLGNKDGAALFLRENPERKPMPEISAEVAGIIKAVDASFDRDGKPLPGAEEAIRKLGASPEDVRRKVDLGLWPTQFGEAVLNAAWGQTLKIEDPDDPKNYQRWVDETSKAEIQRGMRPDQTTAYRLAQATKGGLGKYSKSVQQEIRNEYLGQLNAANIGNPGWSRARVQEMMGKPVESTAGQTALDIANNLGGIVKNEIVGSMLGMGLGVLKDAAAAEVALFAPVATAGKEAQAELARSIELRNRDFANSVTGAKRNVQKWLTPEGRKRASAFDIAAAQLRRTIDEQQDSGQPDQSKIDAAELAVRNAALSMFDLAQDEKWPVTADDLDPNKDALLGSALAKYVATADPKWFDLYKSRMLMDNGRRQHSGEIEKLAAPYGAFGKALIGGMHVGWQELAVELASDIAMVATGGASAAATKGLRVAGKAGMASRLARFTEATSKVLDDIANIGVRRSTLQAPLRGMDAKIAAVGRGANVMVRGAAGESLEEGVIEATADDPNIPKAFAIGALGGFVLTPAFYGMQAGGQAVVNRVAEAKSAEQNAKFAQNYNRIMAGTPDFTPITPKTAAAARFFIDPEAFESKKAEFEAKIRTLDEEIAIGGDSATVLAMEKAVVNDAASRFAQESEAAVRMASAIEAMEPAKQTYWTGMAKVATGNAQTITANERQAIEGATTKDGFSYFETAADPNGNVREVMTNEGRMEAMKLMPEIGALIQNAETRSRFDAEVAQAAATEPAAPATASVPAGEPPLAGEVAAQEAPQQPISPAETAGTGTPTTTATDERQEGQGQRMQGQVTPEAPVATENTPVTPQEATPAAGGTVEPAVTAPVDPASPEGAVNRAVERWQQANPDLQGNIEDAADPDALPMKIRDGKLTINRRAVAQRLANAKVAPENHDRALDDMLAEAVTKAARNAPPKQAPLTGVRQAVDRRVGEMRKKFGARVRIVNDVDSPNGKKPRLFVSVNGNGAAEIVANPQRLMDDAEAFGFTPEQADDYMRRAIDEEIKHVAQYDVARKEWEKSGNADTYKRTGKGLSFFDFLDQTYGARWRAEFEGTEYGNKAAEAYKKDAFDNLSDAGKYFEATRQIMQEMAGDVGVTERFKFLSSQTRQFIADLLKAIADILKKLDHHVELKADIEKVRARLAELEAEANKPEPPPTGGATTPDQAGEVAPVNQAKPKQRRSIFAADSPQKLAFESNGIVAHIIANGGMVSRSRARDEKGKEWWDKNGSLYDDAPVFRNPTFNSIYSKESMRAPDQVAQDLADAGLLKDGDVSAMWAEITKAAESAALAGASAKVENARQKNQLKQLIDFEKTNERKIGFAQPVGFLGKGDKVVLDGEEIVVNEVEYDDYGDAQWVELEDGARFGRQVVQGDAILYVESVEKNPDNGFAPEEDVSTKEDTVKASGTDKEFAEEQAKWKDQYRKGEITVEELGRRMSQWVRIQPQPKTEKPKDKVKSIGSILSDYETGEGNVETVNDIALAIESLEDAPEEALEAVREYRRSVSEDFSETGLRGDVEVYEAKLVSELKEIAAAGKFSTTPETPMQVEAFNNRPLVEDDSFRLTQGETQDGDAEAKAREQRKRDQEENDRRQGRLFAPEVEGLSDAAYARHAELEAKHNAGTITPDEAAEAQRLVDEAAKRAGYTRKVWRGGPLDVRLPWFTEDELEAEKYGEAKAYLLKSENPTDVSGGFSEAKVRDDGYDAVKFQNPMSKEGNYDGQKPQWVPLSPSQIKSAEPFTGVPLRERFNPESPSILRAPEIEGQSDRAEQTRRAINAALERMDPIYAKVYADAARGMDIPSISRRYNISPRAVENILKAVNVRAKLALDNDLTPKVDAAGKMPGARPDLALGANPGMIRVDQERSAEGLPKFNEQEAFDLASDKLENDYEGTKKRIFDKLKEGKQLEGWESHAAVRILNIEGYSTSRMTDEQRMEFGQLAEAWRERGSQMSEEFRMRKDPWMSPAERHAGILATFLNPPDKPTLERVKKRVEELKRRGIDIMATLDRYGEMKRRMDEAERRNPEAAEAVKITIRKRTDAEKQIIFALRGGSTIEQAMSGSGMTRSEVRQVWIDFVNEAKAATAEAVDKEARRITEAALSAPPLEKAIGDKFIELGYVDIDAIERRSLPKEQQAKAKPAKGKTAKQDKPAAWSPDDPFFLQTETAVEGEKLITDEEKNRQDADLNDPRLVEWLASFLSGAHGRLGDALMQWYRMSILSGLQTNIVNVSSTAAHAAYQMLPRRAAEATANSLLKLIGLGSKDAATFGEFRYILKHLRRAAVRGSQHMIQSWAIEDDVFDRYALGEGMRLDKSGKLKKVKVGNEQFDDAGPLPYSALMRALSFRPMMAADNLIKGFYGELEALSQAYRIAKKEGLSGAALDKRITNLMRPASEAWIRAFKATKKMAFQEKLDVEDPRFIANLDRMAEWMKKGRTIPWIGKPISIFIPFIDTPANIFKQAIEMSPLGMGLAIIDAARSVRYRYMRGDLDPKKAAEMAGRLYDKARLVQDFTNQTLAWGAYFAIANLVAPGDDDENALPWITGSTSYKSTRKGERETQMRVMPPMSIRIGKNSFASYNRIEPFATMLAGVVDLVTELNHNEGKVDAQLFGRYMARIKDQMQEKTFLQGMSNLIKAAEDPDRFATNLAANTAVSMVPNIYRQAAREMDPIVRDTAPREDDGFGSAIWRKIHYSLMPWKAPYRFDVWGKPMLSRRGAYIGGSLLSDKLFRIVDPTNLTVNYDPEPIDLYVFHYNKGKADPKDRINLEPIGDFITVTRDGRTEKLPLTLEEQEKANKMAGKLMLDVLGRNWDYRNTTEEGADRIRKIREQAQTIVREQLRTYKLTRQAPTT